MAEIEDFFLFDRLNESDRREIIASLPAVQTFRKGETIYSAEHYANAIGYILGGCAIAKAGNPDGIVMKEFCDGMCFGAAAVFSDGGRYVSTITAKSDCEIQFVTEAALRKLFCEYPQTAINYIAFLSGKIRFLNNKIGVLSCSSTEDTVLRYLTSAADENGTAVVPASMTMLSRMLGIGRASLYRSLDALEKDGLIERQNNLIKVKQNEKSN